jgi:sorbitol/mannitol transport system permease protein
VKSPTRRGSWSRRAPLLPALVITLVLTQIPFALTIWYSLQRWNLLGPGQKGFAGLDNFRATFGDDTSWKAIKNTVVLTGGATIASMAVGLVLAMLLQKKFPGRGLARTLPSHRSSSCPWRSRCSGAAPCSPPPSDSSAGSPTPSGCRV